MWSFHEAAGTSSTFAATQETRSKTTTSSSSRRVQLPGSDKELYIPCRHFRPQIDTLYVADVDLDQLCFQARSLPRRWRDRDNQPDHVQLAMENDRQFFCSVKHMALPYRSVAFDTIQILYETLPHLRRLIKISIVFGRTWERPEKPSRCAVADKVEEPVEGRDSGNVERRDQELKTWILTCIEPLIKFKPDRHRY